MISKEELGKTTTPEMLLHLLKNPKVSLLQQNKKSGHNVLSLAAEEFDNTEIVEFLFEQGCYIDLPYCAGNHKGKTTRQVIEQSNKKLKKNTLPLLVAAEKLLGIAKQNSNESIMDTLRILGKGLNSRQMSDGNTALHLAIVNNNRLMVKALVDHGASINLPNKKGISPWQLAQTSKDPEIRIILDLKKACELMGEIIELEQKPQKKIQQDQQKAQTTQKESKLQSEPAKQLAQVNERVSQLMQSVLTLMSSLDKANQEHRHHGNAQSKETVDKIHLRTIVQHLLDSKSNDEGKKTLLNRIVAQYSRMPIELTKKGIPGFSGNNIDSFFSLLDVIRDVNEKNKILSKTIDASKNTAETKNEQHEKQLRLEDKSLAEDEAVPPLCLAPYEENASSSKNHTLYMVEHNPQGNNYATSLPEDSIIEVEDILDRPLDYVLGNTNKTEAENLKKILSSVINAMAPLSGRLHSFAEYLGDLAELHSELINLNPKRYEEASCPFIHELRIKVPTIYEIMKKLMNKMANVCTAALNLPNSSQEPHFYLNLISDGCMAIDLFIFVSQVIDGIQYSYNKFSKAELADKDKWLEPEKMTSELSLECVLSHTKIADILIKMTKKPKFPPMPAKFSLLDFAICHNFNSLVNYLLSKPEERIFGELDNGYTVLSLMAISANISMIKLMLKTGAYIFEPMQSGEDRGLNARSIIEKYTGISQAALPLLQAAEQLLTLASANSPEQKLYKECINNLGLGLNARWSSEDNNGKSLQPSENNCHGYTALHFAVKYCNRSLVQALIEAGANPNIESSTGISAFDLSKNCVDPFIKTMMLYSSLKQDIVEFRRNEINECKLHILDQRYVMFESKTKNESIALLDDNLGENDLPLGSPAPLQAKLKAVIESLASLDQKDQDYCRMLIAKHLVYLGLNKMDAYHLLIKVSKQNNEYYKQAQSMIHTLLDQQAVILTKKENDLAAENITPISGEQFDSSLNAVSLTPHLRAKLQHLLQSNSKDEALICQEIGEYIGSQTTGTKLMSNFVLVFDLKGISELTVNAELALIDFLRDAYIEQEKLEADLKKLSNRNHADGETLLAQYKQHTGLKKSDPSLAPYTQYTNTALKK